MRYLLFTFVFLRSFHGFTQEEYVEICDCTTGTKGVCKEYLDSNWQIVEREMANWFYYNYNFGRYRFFDWSFKRRFVEKHDYTSSDTTKYAERPRPLNGNFYWYEKESNLIVVEQSFKDGWPSGQTKAYSKKGYLLECLDFDSPYNRGKFSMMCHLYHKGKLQDQCVFAVDMVDNKAFAVGVPWKVDEPPTTLNPFPLYQRSLVLDVRSLQHRYITAEHTPFLFQLITESCYSSSNTPMNYEASSDTTASLLSLFNESRGWRVNQIYAPKDMESSFSSVGAHTDIFCDDNEFELMKMCRSSLRENSVKHMLLVLDTLENVLQQHSDSSYQFLEALTYADRCVGQLMQYMRLNVREMDWNCVMITATGSNKSPTPWLLWGEGVRSNFILDNVNPHDALVTFEYFSHMNKDRIEDAAVLWQCFSAKNKRK